MGRVEVVYCTAPGAVDRVELALWQGATVGGALEASGLLARHGLAIDGVQAGVWGKLRALDAPLRDRDRVEIYRPLKVDPKEARRLRFRQQAAQKAALSPALSRKRERR